MFKVRTIFFSICILLILQARASVVLNNFYMDVQILNPFVPGTERVDLCPGSVLQLKNISTYGNNWPVTSSLTGTYKISFLIGSTYYTPSIPASTWYYNQIWNITIPGAYGTNVSPYNLYINYYPGPGEIIGTNPQLQDLIYVRVLPVPTITVSPNVSICPGQSTTLTASGGLTYHWLPATGLSSTTIANPVASPTVTTTYTVTGTNSNGCQGSATITVTVLTAPGITFVPNGQTICNGSSVTIGTSVSGGGTPTYSWSILNTISPNTFASLPGTGSSITLNSATYTPYIKTAYGFQYILVQVTVSNGNCTSSATTLIILNQPVILNGYTTEVDVCYYGSGSPPPAYFSVSSTTAWGYSWEYSINAGASWSPCSSSPPFTGQTTATLSIQTSSLMNGWLFRCVLDGNYCPDLITNPAILRVYACARTDGSLTETTSASAAPGISCSLQLPDNGADVLFVILQQRDANMDKWHTIAHSRPSNDGSVIASAGEEVVSADNNAPIRWVIVKADGPETVMNADCSQKNSTQETQLLVYPNPATDELNVSGINGEAQVTVMTIDGRILSVNQFNSAVKLNVGELSPGIYLLRVTDESGTHTKQFVRE